VAIQSASSSRTVAAESRNTRNSGHGPPVSRDDNGEGDLVSDGVVTWRRKLPDLGDIGRASSTMDHHHHHHHQRHVTKHLAADSRKMSIPAAAGDWSTTAATSARRDRRDAFAQQKSFSYEAACIGRRLPPTPDELAAAARARRAGTARSGGTAAAASTTAAHPVDRRRRMLMESKKSYSLDDQIAPSHVAASDVAGHVYGTESHEPPAPRDAGRLQISRDTGRSAAREPSVSGERSPSGGHRKLLMLHTMRALQQDNFESTSSTTSDRQPPDPHSASADSTTATAAAAAVQTSTVVHSLLPKPTAPIADPPPRVPPPTSRVDRLPIARIWSRLKFDRRAVAASGKK